MTTSNVTEIGRHQVKKQKVIIEEKQSKESDVLKILLNNNTNLEDLDLIDKCFLKNVFMRNLEKNARLEVIKQMAYCTVAKDTVVFSQGSIGNYFYIVKEGKLDLYIDDNKRKTIFKGESFGELALLHGTVRSGTVRAVEPTYLWCLERRKFKQVVDYITSKNFEENKAFIKSIPIISNLDNELIARLCSSLIKETYDSGNFIVKEGDIADCLYIIKEGTVECTKKEQVIRILGKGDFFGTSSILIQTTRTMNVIAKSTCICYSISVETLTNILGPNYREALYLSFVKMTMRNSKYFSNVSSYFIEKTFPAFKVKMFKKDKIVISKGTRMDNKIQLIIEGKLIIPGKSSVYADRGKLLFEDEIINFQEIDTNNNYEPPVLDFDLIADPDCLIVEADIFDFIKLLGGTVKQICEKTTLINSLANIPLFKTFSLSKIRTVADSVHLENFKSGDKIIQEGEDGSKFYIVKSGNVDIFVKGQYIRTLTDNEFFGERSLFIEEVRSATAIAKGTVTLYVLSKENFKHIIEENMKEYIIQRIALQDNTIELKDLNYVQNLGNGNYGNVYLVNCTKNKCLYAIKTISKKQIDQEQLHFNLEMERKILLKIDHPFIMKMVKTLKDTESIYFLMEYVKGKELWDVIREIGLLNKAQTLFYGCSMLLAVEYLHKRKFVYRDLKPENILVTEQVNIIMNILGVYQNNRFRYS